MTAKGQYDPDEVLGPDEMLAHAPLVGPAVRDAVRLFTGVRIGRPVVYPLDARDLPAPLRRRAEAMRRRYLGVLFAFDLDELPAGHRYASARFTVELAHDGLLALAVHGDGGQFGLIPGAGPDDPPGVASTLAVRTLASVRRDRLSRLGLRADRPSARGFGMQTHRFGWVYLDPRGSWLVPRNYGTHAVIEAPVDLGELPGAIAVTADVDSGGWAVGRRRVTTQEKIAFAEPLSPAPPHRSAATAAPGRGSPPTVGAAAVRLCMAADVAGYSGRTNAEAERVQHDLAAVLAQARNAAGVSPAEVTPQPQGDGQFTVLPVGLDESVAIPCLVRGLAAALAARNAARGDDPPMRLRLALHRGLVKEGDLGWVGRAAIAVHRLLDSPPLRAALRDHPAADFVLAVPDVLYLDVLADSGESPRGAEFTRITVDLPAKGFLEQAWLYVPDRETAS